MYNCTPYRSDLYSVQLIIIVDISSVAGYNSIIHLFELIIRGDNMNIYTVTFFGHRYVDNMLKIEEKLEPILKELINQKEYVEFDQIVSSAIRKAKERYDYGNVSHILVLPYERADYRDNKDSFEDYYDEVQISSSAAAAHPKAAIGVRNRAMIDRSDLVICYVEKKNGGAYNAMKYAESIGKKVINLIDV